MLSLDSVIVPPWAKWLAALLVVLSVAVAIYSYGRQQFGLGEQAEKARWLARDNQALADANKKITALEAAARETERRHAERLANVSARYQEDLQHVTTEKNRALAAVRSGAVQLRIPITGAVGPGGSAAGAAAAATGGRDGETRAELSAAAAEFLVGLASDADEVVHQLDACQSVVLEDRVR